MACVLGLAAFAAGVRLLVLACTVLGGAAVDHGVSLADVAQLHDGREYLMVAAALGSSERTAALPAEARRLGVGYPLLIRSTSAVVPPHLAALGLAVLGAAAATALLLLLGIPARAVALFAVLTPSWVAFSATAMSEGPFVAIMLLGLLVWRRDSWRSGAAAGMLFGASAIVRPVGAVVFAALWLVRTRLGGRGRSGSDRVAGMTVAPIAGFALPVVVWAAGAAVGLGFARQVGTYMARDLAVPFASLVHGFTTPLSDPLKWAQNVLVVGLVGAASWVLASRVRTGDSSTGTRSRDWLAWLVSQVGFALVLPSSWVFECLARFVVPALPAVAAALEPWVPRRRSTLGIALAVVTSVSVGVSVLWNLRALGVVG